MACALIPLAQGCEELEAVTLIDLLRRAGVEVVTAGLDEHPVRGARGTMLVPDTTLDKALAREYDVVALPGGQPGSDHLNRDPRIITLLQNTACAGRYVAAICAAPLVLAHAGLLRGKKATGYPGVLERLQLTDTTLETAAVVKDGYIVTSRGPGTAIDFALELINCLCGPEQRNAVEQGLQRV